jgi:hypothetical protein
MPLETRLNVRTCELEDRLVQSSAMLGSMSKDVPKFVTYDAKRSQCLKLYTGPCCRDSNCAIIWVALGHWMPCSLSVMVDNMQYQASSHYGDPAHSVTAMCFARRMAVSMVWELSCFPRCLPCNLGMKIVTDRAAQPLSYFPCSEKYTTQR